MLLDNNSGVRPHARLIRAEHSESFDQEFTRAAVNLFLGVAAERTSEKVVGFCFFLRPGRPGIGFGLGSLRLRPLSVGFSRCCFSLGRLGASTCCGSLRLLTAGCRILLFLFIRLNAFCAFPTGLSLRPKCGTVAIAALTPREEAIDPRGGLADCFGDLSLGRALRLSSRNVFSGGVQGVLAGLDCTLRPAQ